MSKDKLEELIAATKIGELINKKEEDKKEEELSNNKAVALALSRRCKLYIAFFLELVALIAAGGQSKPRLDGKERSLVGCRPKDQIRELFKIDLYAVIMLV